MIGDDSLVVPLSLKYWHWLAGLDDGAAVVGCDYPSYRGTKSPNDSHACNNAYYTYELALSMPGASLVRVRSQPLAEDGRPTCACASRFHLESSTSPSSCAKFPPRIPRSSAGSRPNDRMEAISAAGSASGQSDPNTTRSAPCRRIIVRTR